MELVGLQTVGRTDGWLQLHPGESASVIIHTHLLERAPSGVSASFDVVVESVQYNQDPYDMGLMKWGSDIVLNEEVPVGFLNWSVSDNEEPPFPDVCEATLDAFDIAGDGDVDCLLLVLNRWYEGYTATVEFDIQNCGSTPLRCAAVNIVPTVPETVEVAVIGPMGSRIGPGDCTHCLVVAEICADMPMYCGFFASIEYCEALE